MSPATCLPVYLDRIDEQSRSSTVDIVGYLNIRYSMKMLPTITSALSAFGSSWPTQQGHRPFRSFTCVIPVSMSLFVPTAHVSQSTCPDQSLHTVEWRTCQPLSRNVTRLRPNYPAERLSRVKPVKKSPPLSTFWTFEFSAEGVHWVV